MKLRTEILRLKRQVETLKAQLKAHNIEAIEIPRWALNLTAQQAALMGILLAKSPRCIHMDALADAIPHRDHVNDYDSHGINVIVHNIREKLGFDAIETVVGRGYRVGPLFRDAKRDIAALKIMEGITCAKAGGPVKEENLGAM